MCIYLSRGSLQSCLADFACELLSMQICFIKNNPDVRKLQFFDTSVILVLPLKQL